MGGSVNITILYTTVYKIMRYTNLPKKKIYYLLALVTIFLVWMSFILSIYTYSSHSEMKTKRFAQSVETK